MKTKTIIIIVLIFLLLLGGVFAAYYFISSQETTFETQEESFFDTIFPFGGRPDDTRTTPEEQVVVDLDEAGEAPRLRHVSSFPIAGMFTFLNEEDEEIIRYVEKGTGHIYETKTSELGQGKVSNTTIPRIHEAVWIDESTLILRYFNDSGDLESFYAELKNGSLSGSFIEKNIKNIKVIGNTLRYLSDTSTGSAIIRTSLDGSNRTTLYNSEFSEWNIDWWSSSLAILTTKTSGASLGNSFFLNTNSGNLTKIFDSIPSLSVLPNTDNDDVLFSSNTEGLTLLFVLNTETKEFSGLNVQTLSEKCIWGEKDMVYCSVPIQFEKGLYPDDWYKGTVSFTDDIWSIDVERGTTNVVEYLDDAIDGINLTLSPSGKYLLFTNKKDSTLWSLRLDN